MNIGGSYVTKLCPVCGNNAIKPIHRSALVQLDGDFDPPGIIAYRCGKGHLFLMAPETRMSATPKKKSGRKLK